MLAFEGLHAAMVAVLSMMDLFPSGEELALLTTAKELEVAIQELLDHGIKTIVHKQGAEESRYIARGANLITVNLLCPRMIQRVQGIVWCNL